MTGHSVIAKLPLSLAAITAVGPALSLWVGGTHDPCIEIPITLNQDDDERQEIAKNIKGDNTKAKHKLLKTNLYSFSMSM